MDLDAADRLAQGCTASRLSDVPHAPSGHVSVSVNNINEKIQSWVWAQPSHEEMISHTKWNFLCLDTTFSWGKWSGQLSHFLGYHKLVPRFFRNANVYVGRAWYLFSRDHDKIGPKFLEQKSNVFCIVQPTMCSMLGVYDIQPPPPPPMITREV